jgi:2-phospho-L-lactate guanylyltransferase
MNVIAIVPVKRFDNAKTRLSAMLSPEDRVALSSLMLEETMNRLARTDGLKEIVIVSSDERARKVASFHGATFLHEDRESGVNAAVELADGYAMDKRADATIVIPQDLPLLDAKEIASMCKLAESDPMCVVICPSRRYDGTNALLRKPPNVIPTFFDNNSYENHITAARERNLTVRVFSSPRLMMDLDTPEDARVLAQAHTREAGKVLDFIRDMNPAI